MDAPAALPVGIAHPTMHVQERFSAERGRSAGQPARENRFRRRRRQKRPDLGDHDAGARLGDRKRRQGALGYETANDAIDVAGRTAFVVAALAGGAGMIRVLVAAAMLGAGFGSRSGAVRAGMAMPHAAERAGQHVADRYAPGSSAMVPARDHDALWLQMQLNCRIIRTGRRQGQYRSELENRYDRPNLTLGTRLIAGLTSIRL